MNKEKIKVFLKKIAGFLFNPRFLFCFGIAWIITNGWSYIAFGIGTYFKINWLLIVSSAYLAFLWLPFTPEKLITVIIAIAFLKLLFPNDKKTLSVLKNIKSRVLNDIAKRKNKKNS